MTTTTNPFEQFLLGLQLAASNEFDENGLHQRTGKEWNSRGFNAQGINKITGTNRNRGGSDQFGYDADGFHQNGWNTAGLHRNGTSFDDTGFDIHGFDRDGWLTQGWHEHSFAADEWLRSRDTESPYYTDNDLPIHRATGTSYGPDGFNYFQFDAQGYDADGFSRGGDYGTHVWTDREGYFRSGFDEYGFARDGYNARGLDNLGFTRDRLHATTGTVWSPDGIHGLTGTGYGPDGYDERGWDNKGFGRDGYAYNGFNADRIHKETGTPYNPKGYTRGHLDIKGFHRNSVIDGLGYILGERAPSRVYDLAGWNHHVLADKLKTNDTDPHGRTPRNLFREGWRHEAGQGWNADTGLYELTTAFTHKDTGTRLNPEGFTVVGITPDKNINERGFNVDTRLHSVTGDRFDEQGLNFTRTELASR